MNFSEIEIMRNIVIVLKEDLASGIVVLFEAAEENLTYLKNCLQSGDYDSSNNFVALTTETESELLMDAVFACVSSIISKTQNV